MARLGIEEGQLVSASTWGDSGLRRVGGLVALAYDIPEGCVAGFYPECNALIPVWHHAARADVPAAKCISIRVTRDIDSTNRSPY